ncbi:hypothetical protein [Thalassolituus sp.]|uniref:HvfA family oxazolone/thioamide-modified RiPP metallophore n=1 Tax=Thalassolituus sp. TaxID=2030822 RepID=UPI002A814734|nr:hypothetical protein [Thalassolituus sp.]
MKKNTSTLTSALSAAVLLGASAASFAAENPFASQSLTSGYQVAEKAEMEGKCGGKTEMKGKSEAEGKCGGKSEAEGKCGGKAEMKGKADAEGKCGGDKAKKEGKCGEGKCGAAK